MTLQRLYDLTLQKNRKRDIDKVLLLRDLLGCPDLAYPVIHVAGTNGKGSVSLKIAKALELSGLKVGLYTSPHISSFRERIVVQSEMIQEEEFARHLQEIFSLIDQKEISCTFFEVTTLLAFLHFKKKKVDAAVIEVGLGGRLDTTNFVQPILSVITSIGMDHTAILGDTLEKIAVEKAGIIKERTPVVLGPKAHFAQILHIAKEKSAPVMHADVLCPSFYDEENRQTAKCALVYLQPQFHLKEEIIEKALALRPSCRFEKVRENVILDVAHNPPAFERLVDAVKVHFPGRKVRFFLAFSEDKDKKSSLEKILPLASHIHLVRTPHPRLTNPEGVRKILMELGFTAASTSEDLPSELQKALLLASDKKEILVISGSFFIMKEVRKILGFQDVSDPVELQEQFTFSESRGE